MSESNCSTWNTSKGDHHATQKREIQEDNLKKYQHAVSGGLSTEASRCHRSLSISKRKEEKEKVSEELLRRRKMELTRIRCDDCGVVIAEVIEVGGKSDFSKARFDKIKTTICLPCAENIVKLMKAVKESEK